MLWNRKAQAIIELAILGSLIIVAFSILISYSERYNREQSYMQQTFRATLKKAKEINDSASWSTTDFRRMPNVSDPMEIGALNQFGSSNSVLWSDGKKLNGEETEPKAYFQLNRNPVVIEIPASTAAPPQAGDFTFSSSFHESSLNSTTSFSKQESGNNITTHKTLGATDSISGSATIGDTAVLLDSDLGSGGVYYPGGGLIR